MSDENRYIHMQWHISNDDLGSETFSPEAMKKLNDAIREWASSPEGQAKLRQTIEQSPTLSMSTGYEWPSEKIATSDDNE